MLKVLFGAVILCVIETLNGILRIHFFTKKFGRKKAKALSFIFGLLMATCTMMVLIPWVNPHNFLNAFLLGLTWAILLGIYDIWVGRVLFKLSWEKVLKDFDLREGNLLSLGFLFIIFFPPLFLWMYN